MLCPPSWPIAPNLGLFFAFVNPGLAAAAAAAVAAAADGSLLGIGKRLLHRFRICLVVQSV